MGLPGSGGPFRPVPAHRDRGSDRRGGGSGSNHQASKPDPKPAVHKTHSEAKPKPAPKPAVPEDRVQITGSARSVVCDITDSSGSHTVNTGVPATIKVKPSWGSTTIASCVNNNMSGAYTVKLYEGGDLVAHKGTSAPMGSAVVSDQ